MKLNNQTLRSRSVGPLKDVEYLDLSELGLVSLGHLTSCPKVASLLLRGNGLQDASGLESCQQLWHLDLSNNQLVSLEGLYRFLCLGTLVLSRNQLTWSSLAHLRHTHILNLSLQGNPQLDKEPYYRIHVIDCLPNVWTLDGRIVTSAERIQVRQFFQDSALSDRPVRHKLKKDSFVPSTLKKIEIDGIFGEKAVQVMTSFPKQAVLNVETDWKRIEHLAQVLQEDMSLEWRYTANKPGGLDLTSRPNFLTDLFNARFTNREQCNMVLLMLVASLNFVLPTHLVRDTLDTGKLLTIGSVQTMDLFLLPRLLRCKVVSLLVSAVKVDREQNEDGGLYTKLYLCLYHMVSELTRLSETNGPINQRSTAHHTKLAEQLEDYKCLLATEVVQLMCIVPSFFDYLDRDIDVMNLMLIATGDPDISKKLSYISKTQGKDDQMIHNVVFKWMGDFVLMKLQEQLQNLINKATVMSACDRILSKSDALPMKGENNPVCKAEYLVKGVILPDDDPPAVNPRKMSAQNRARFPHLGDTMLLGPQTIGKIISLPQPTMALVIIDAVPVASGAVEHKLKVADHHFTYVKMDQLQWDTAHTMWKPKGTVGDKFTLQAAEDFNREALNGSFQPVTPEIIGASDMEAIRASTPLIFTNTPIRVCVPTGNATHQPKTRQSQRPLSSVYKERLKLSLDLSRRAQSAGSQQPFPVTYGSKTSTPRNRTVASLKLDQMSGLKVDKKGSSSRQDREGVGGGGGAAWSQSSRRGSSEVTPTSDSVRAPLMTTLAKDRNGAGMEERLGSARPASQSTLKSRKREEEGKENEPPTGQSSEDTGAPPPPPPPSDTDTRPSKPEAEEEDRDTRPSKPEVEEEDRDTRPSKPEAEEEDRDTRPSKPEAEEEDRDTRPSKPEAEEEDRDTRPSKPEVEEEEEEEKEQQQQQQQQEKTSPQGGEQTDKQDERKMAGRHSGKPSPDGGGRASRSPFGLMTLSSDPSCMRSRQRTAAPDVSTSSATNWRDKGDRDKEEEGGGGTSEQMKEIFLTSLSESPRTFARPYSGYQLAGRSRPVSALEISMREVKASDNIYHTEFQQQRIDAWKKTTRPATAKVTGATCSPPPPQPPSSPIPPASPSDEGGEGGGEQGDYSPPPPSGAVPPPHPHLLMARSLDFGHSTGSPVPLDPHQRASQSDRPPTLGHSTGSPVPPDQRAFQSDRPHTLGHRTCSPVPLDQRAFQSDRPHTLGHRTCSPVPLDQRAFQSGAPPTIITPFRLPRTKLWLAGGRDLFREGVKRRPKSGHIPGWKEGLPTSIAKPRPQSAAARLFRRIKTQSIYSSSTPKKNPIVHGTMPNDQADFPGTGEDVMMSCPRGWSQRYSCQRSLYDEDPLPGPVPDTVYSPIKVISYQRPPYSFLRASSSGGGIGGGSSNAYLPCVYEDYLQDLDYDYESHYTPACNTPTD